MAPKGAMPSIAKTDPAATVSTAKEGVKAAVIDAKSDVAQKAEPSTAASAAPVVFYIPYCFTMPHGDKFTYPLAEGEREEIDPSTSCDVLRRKINMYLATKEMTQARFRLECGNIASSSFNKFMNFKGPEKGCENGTYIGALKFFARRDKAKAAEKKAQSAEQQQAKKAAKRIALEAGVTASAVPVSSGAPVADALPTKKARTDAVSSSSTSAVTAASEYLSPEAITAPPLRDDTPVFDDCDEVRRKLAQCIQSPGMSQVKIAKYIGVTGAAISKFLSRHGKDGGAGTDVYPRAYRYFERLRVMRNEPKSSHRKRIESKFPNGLPLVNPPKKHKWTNDLFLPFRRRRPNVIRSLMRELLRNK